MGTIRWVALATCVASVAQAAPRLAPPAPAANRRPAHVSWPPRMIEQFALAVIADKRGDYSDAVRIYEGIIRTQPLINVYWNLADLAIRRERYTDARRNYEKIVELADDPADKAAATAQLDKLAARPYRISVSGDEPGGAIFIDGVKFPASAPAVIEVDDGDHRVHWVGREGYAQTTVHATPGAEQLVALNAEKRGTRGGNVIISVPAILPVRSGAFDVGGAAWTIGERIQVAPGTYRVPLGTESRACDAITVDVPRDGVVFVYVTATQPAPGSYCFPVRALQTKVTP